MKCMVFLLAILGLFAAPSVMALRFASAESLGLSGAEKEAYESKINAELKKWEQMQQEAYQSRIQLSDAEKKEITERKARMKLREEADHKREEANKEITVPAGKDFSVTLRGGGSSGWKLKIMEFDKDYVQFIEEKFIKDPYVEPLVKGGASLVEYHFKAIKQGITKIVFGYEHVSRKPELLRLKTSTIIIK